MTPSIHERRFRAMNTNVALWLWSDECAAGFWLEEAEALFGEVEAALSRFRPDSELSRLNAAAGQGPQVVSETMNAVLTQALQSADRSQGVFDPTVLTSLRRAGYVRSFELLPASDEGADDIPPVASDGVAVGWQAIDLDGPTATVSLPAGLGIDLGGIAKGWTVDRAAAMLGVWGAALVDAGGDIRASAAPGGEPWPIAVRDPFDANHDIGVLTLTDNAVATSTIGRRRWQKDGQTMHHLIDPRTGEPSRSDLHTVTVIAPSTAEAEVASKVALILGRTSGRSYLEDQALAGVLVDRHGGVEIVGTPGLTRHSLNDRA